mgnify:CR=1 FL=1
MDRYFQANAGNADVVERKLKEMGADYVVGIDLSTQDAKPSLLKKFFPTLNQGQKNRKVHCFR